MELNFISAEKILNNPELYFAHKNSPEKNREGFETLEEHTILCQKYFSWIFEKKGIGECIGRFLDTYMGTAGEEERELVREMWCNVVTFHDVGKHNPNFQRNVLGRKEVRKDPAYGPAGNRHSALSAVLYMDYYLKRIRKIGGVQGKKMCLLMLCNAHAIARHHSGLTSVQSFICGLIDGNDRGITKIFLQARQGAYAETFELDEKNLRKLRRFSGEASEALTREQGVWLYFYGKLTYSMLVAADYYATSGFMSDVWIESLGGIEHIEDFCDAHQNTSVNRAIRAYEKERYPLDPVRLKEEKQINILRNEIFLDAERQLLKEKQRNIFYLEAPTGSGKSNVSINLSLQLAMQDKQLKKIYYVYPFNTLVEQNQDILQNVFESNPEILSDIAVVNSITPIKCVQKSRQISGEEEENGYYEQALLNRQFLNYPMILTTHVSLFDTLFGDTKESAFAFYQLPGSIIVLDEIQSYKNSLWGEIITFLTEAAKFMHMKIIIMSATLPDLGQLKDKSEHTGYLIQNREKYFCHPCFKERVKINGELLAGDMSMERLCQHIEGNCGKGKKILVEFITKSHAEEAYHILKNKDGIKEKIFCMTGDDSILERKKIIGEIKKQSESAILVSTQVVEAGVDIDMDIGYKNIAKMDSEEQFLGRINRSYSRGRDGVVYFFQLDTPRGIYRNDIRTEREFMITQPEIWDMLENKDFESYYGRILKIWKRNYGEVMGQDFFGKQVGELDFPQVKKHMQLIDDDRLNISVFLGRKLVDDESGEVIDGNALWKEYKELLRNGEMGYAKKKVQMSDIMAKMNCFIYQLYQELDVSFDDQIGELFYIADGENYFEDGRLNRKKLTGQLGEFVEFF